MPLLSKGKINVEEQVLPVAAALPGNEMSAITQLKLTASLVRRQVSFSWNFLILNFDSFSWIFGNSTAWIGQRRKDY